MLLQLLEGPAQQLLPGRVDQREAAVEGDRREQIAGHLEQAGDPRLAERGFAGGRRCRRRRFAAAPGSTVAPGSIVGSPLMSSLRRACPDHHVGPQRPDSADARSLDGLTRAHGGSALARSLADVSRAFRRAAGALEAQRTAAFRTALRPRAAAGSRPLRLSRREAPRDGHRLAGSARSRGTISTVMIIALDTHHSQISCSVNSSR